MNSYRQYHALDKALAFLLQSLVVEEPADPGCRLSREPPAPAPAANGCSSSAIWFPFRAFSCLTFAAHPVQAMVEKLEKLPSLAELRETYKDVPYYGNVKLD